eukprot:7727621-Prorocentrum_lima.AAC.1
MNFWLAATHANEFGNQGGSLAANNRHPNLMLTSDTTGWTPKQRDWTGKKIWANHEVEETT